MHTFHSLIRPGRIGRLLGAILLLAGAFAFTSSTASAQINYDCKTMNANFTGKNGWLRPDRISGVFGLNYSGATYGLGTNGRTQMRYGYLETKMPRGGVSGRETGFRFDLAFPGTTEAELRYRVGFDANYHWTLGGKLPGLGGGGSTGAATPPRGCTSVKDKGFSARLMFRNDTENGAGYSTNKKTAYMINYLYYQGVTSRCGENMKWDRDLRRSGTQRVLINRGTWYEFRQYVKLNTGNNTNGRLKTWYRQCSSNNSCSGSWIRVADKAMKWRKSGQSWNINKILMETYHGGADDRWAPARTNTAYFDDFVLYRKGSCSSGREAGVVGGHMVDMVEVEDFGYDAPLKITAFPNPATDLLTVRVPFSRSGQMTLLDLRGRTVRQAEIAAEQMQTDVNLSDLKPGMYLVRFASGGEIVTQKIIKR